MNYNTMQKLLPEPDLYQLSLQDILKDNNEISDKTSEYLQFFNHQLFTQFQFVSIVEQSFQEMKDNYNLADFSKNISIEISEHTKSFRLLTLKIKIGYFTLNIRIINQKNQSPCHKLKQCLSCQLGGKIYFPMIGNQAFTIKCFPIDFDQDPSMRLGAILKQYCLLKIASYLNVGPQLSNSFGFDLIIYDKCIEFSMQKCTPLDKYLQNTNDDDFNYLKKDLLVLHYLNIVHLDIKPANILYSPKKKKLVLIDFGLSKVISQKIGYKSKSEFVGTYAYCSPQMKKLSVISNPYTKIDLYFNDTFGLKKIIEEGNFNKSSNNPSSRDKFQVIERPQYISLIEEFAIIVKLKFIIFTKQQGTLDLNEYRRLILQNQNQIKIFINELQLSIHFQQIYALIEILQQLKSYSSQKSLSKQSVISNLINRNRKGPQEKLKLPNIFYQRMKLCLNEGEHEKEKENQAVHAQTGKQIAFMIGLNYKHQLLDKQKIKQMKKGEYYRKIIEFIDLRSSQNTIEDKIRVIDLFFQVEQISLQSSQFQVQGEILIINKYLATLKHIQLPYISHLYSQYEIVIPVIILNLLIIQAFKKTDILTVLKLIVRITIPEEHQIMVMLVSIYSIIYWIPQFAYFIDQEQRWLVFQIKNIILQRVLIIQDKNLEQIKVLTTLLYSHINNNQISQQQCNYMINFVNKSKLINLKSKQTIYLMILFKTIQRQQKNHKQKYDLVKSIVKLQYFGKNLILSKRNINVAQMHLYPEILKSSDSNLIDSIYFTLVNSIQIEQITKNFHIVYQYRIKRSIHLSTSQRISIFIQIMKNKYLQYNQFVLKQFSNLIFQKFSKTSLKHSDQLSIAKIKEVFTYQFLSQMPIPTKITSFNPRFVQTLKLLSPIYFMLYSRQQKIVQLIKNIVRKISSDKKIRNQEQLNYHQNCIRLITIETMIKQCRQKEALKQCTGNILRLIDQQSFSYNESSFLLQIIIYLIEIIQQIYQKEGYFVYLLNKPLMLIFRTFERCKLQSILLNSIKSQHIFLFLSQMQLIVGRDIDSFLSTQYQFLKIIHEFPSESNIVKYNRLLTKFISKNKRNIYFIKEQFILSLFFKFQELENPYKGLIFAAFSYLYKKDQSFSNKSLKTLCISIQLVTTTAKTILLQKIFSHILLFKKELKRNSFSKRKSLRDIKYLKKQRYLTKALKRLIIFDRQQKIKLSIFQKQMFKKVNRFILHLKQ